MFLFVFLCHFYVLRNKSLCFNFFQSGLATWVMLHKCEKDSCFSLSGVPFAAVLFRILPLPVGKCGAILIIDPLSIQRVNLLFGF